MSQGWISLHRQIKGHWLYVNKPFDNCHAWLDILLSVNHEDRKVLFDGQLIPVKAGQMITSLSKLTEKWGWENRSKTRRFLELLLSDGMVELERNKNGTLLTVANWAKYQIRETQTEHSRNTGETQSDTNNNDNNENNENKKINDVSSSSGKPPKGKKTKTYPHDCIEWQAVEYMIGKILENNPNANVPDDESKKQKWADDFNKVLRIDGKPEIEFKRVLGFAMTDSFWSANVLSPGKFRKQYDQLFANMKGNKDSRQGGIIEHFKEVWEIE